MKQAKIDKTLSQLDADAANDYEVLRRSGVSEADALAAVSDKGYVVGGGKPADGTMAMTKALRARIRPGDDGHGKLSASDQRWLDELRLRMDPALAGYEPVPMYESDPEYVRKLDEFDSLEGAALTEAQLAKTYLDGRVAQDVLGIAGLLQSGAKVFTESGGTLEEKAFQVPRLIKEWAAEAALFVAEQESVDRFIVDDIDNHFHGVLREAYQVLLESRAERDLYLTGYPSSVQSRQNQADAGADMIFLRKSEPLLSDIADMMMVSTFTYKQADLTARHVNHKFGLESPATIGNSYLKLQADHVRAPWRGHATEAFAANEEILALAGPVSPALELPPPASRAQYLENLIVTRARVQEIYYRQVLPTFDALMQHWSAQGQGN